MPPRLLLLRLRSHSTESAGERKMDRREELITARQERPESSQVSASRPSLGSSLRVALLVSAAALTPLLCPVASAQQAQAAEAAPADTQSLETVVVTASATSRKKLEASYSIIAADEEMIRQSNAKSTADLLKISPGIWPESTGGQTGANIEIAGFPGG